jgi:hypothetical protein
LTGVKVVGIAVGRATGGRTTSTGCRSTGFLCGGSARGAGGTRRTTTGWFGTSSNALRHGTNDRIATSAVANIAAVITSEIPKLGQRGSGVVRSNHRGPFVASIGVCPQPPRFPNLACNGSRLPSTQHDDVDFVARSIRVQRVRVPVEILYRTTSELDDDVAGLETRDVGRCSCTYANELRSWYVTSGHVRNGAEVDPASLALRRIRSGYRAVKSVFPLIPRQTSASSVDVLSTSSRLTSSFGECMYRLGIDTSPVATPSREM